MKPPKRCPLTGQPMQEVFRHQVLGKYDVAYFYGEESGLLQTEEPYWLPEAYQEAIARSDTYGAARGVFNQRRLETILALLFAEEDVFVDVGCGYGLLVRLMRDIGFRYLGHDKFCENIFSAHFQPGPDTRAAAITLMEVMEHLTDPRPFLEEQMQRYHTDTVLISTNVFEGAVPPVSWTYYGFENGQHVTIYQPRTLDLLARSLGCRYHRLMADLHLITRRSFAPWRLAILRHGKLRTPWGWMTRWRRRHRSFTESDSQALRALSGAGAKAVVPAKITP
jgi:hypothetical protein